MSAATGTQDRRGSVWNRWDPHIHAPGTILSDRYKGPEPWKDFVSLVDKSDPPIRALGITDYYSTDAYESVLKLRSKSQLSRVALIFPNVEMRLGIGTSKGLGINIHLLFSPEDPDHVERIRRFLSELHFQFQGERYQCERAHLIRLGRTYDRSIKDDQAALREGSKQFKVDFVELEKCWKDSAWVRENALVAIAGGSNDGTSGLKDDDSFAALRQSIERFAHIIFSGQPQQREFWLGKGKLPLSDIVDKWGGPKPCLHGSDAHSQDKVGKPSLDRFCWIKGDLSFDSLRQACIEPEFRALVGPEPLSGSLPSQTIDTVEVQNAQWLATKIMPLNSGLIAVIGSRGSGKTALADLIAAGSYSLSGHLGHASFVRRAFDLLGNSTCALHWASGEETSAKLASIEESEEDELPRAQYLSQQFVNQLCSAEGLEDSLLTEIERVIFDHHAVGDRLGAGSFRELLDLRLARARDGRARADERLANASELLAIERARKASLEHLTKQREEQFKSIEKDKTDRKALTAKGTEARVTNLNQISLAVDKSRSRLETAKRKQQALLMLQDSVNDIRQRAVPAQLKRLREAYADASLTDAEWANFQLVFAGDVDLVMREQSKNTAELIKAIAGPGQAEIAPDPEAPAPDASYIPAGMNLNSVTLSLLEKELLRLQKLVGVDTENAKRLSKLSEKIAKDEASLVKLDKALELAKQADGRMKELFAERNAAYGDAFNSIVEEQQELIELYRPLEANLKAQPGEVSKLAFTVRRIADVGTWAKNGEELLDLRTKGPFKGKGTLEAIANELLRPAWEQGSSLEVATAMATFRSELEQEIVDRAPVDRSDKEGFASWARRISDWLYDTSHVKVSYSLRYAGVEIEQLSPGTRGIVLLLLYVALDLDDARPLIIDQPEENLDPKSIYEELVQSFRLAKKRRQIIIVTHNANLVVNTDADQVIIATCGPHRPGLLPELSYESGGLENSAIRKQVCEILEGGEKAFRERAKRLRITF
jgi:hypothetical protein